jgi:two-component system sensor histidine kinase HydH
VLLLACRQPGAFADRDVLAISVLSDHLATAVDNAHLVTRLKEAQDQLVRKERLAALGQMAATVAHELRNPLRGVRMGVDYFARELTPGERHQRAANLLKNNVDRIDRIVEEVLFLGRESQFNVQPGRLKAIIEQELDRWAPVLADKNIRVSSHLVSLPPILVDPDQIGRAVSNLIGNSVDVLPSGGALNLDLHVAGQDQVFTLSDNGPGISPEQLARIFEPFFTTKARGTGLGLAIVEHVIKQHGGHVDVSSEVGAGTRFIITLPA